MSRVRRSITVRSLPPCPVCGTQRVVADQACPSCARGASPTARRLGALAVATVVGAAASCGGTVDVYGGPPSDDTGVVTDVYGGPPLDTDMADTTDEDTVEDDTSEGDAETDTGESDASETDTNDQD